jgi:phosphoribosylanthranilate isomerase
MIDRGADSGDGDQRALVKICGLLHRDDARRADVLGADYLGTVLSEGFRRSVTTDEARAVLEGTGATRVAVLVDESPERAAQLAHSVDAGVIQLHGRESPASVRTLCGLGEWTVWKAVRAGSLRDLREAVEGFGDIVDGFLVEGRLDGVVGGGGARLTLDPDAVRRTIPEGRTFILAGGITPDTVQDAVARFGPHVVDVSSGVEVTPGRKDHARLEAFILAARTRGVAGPWDPRQDA